MGDEKNITNKTEISDVCEKESNSEIEQEKIDEIEDDQQKSEASNPLGNATEETVRDIDEDSSQEEIIEIQEVGIDDPLQKQGTESITGNEIEDDKPNSDDGKLIDDNQVDEETGKEAGGAGMIESAVNSQEDVAISSNVEDDENEEKNITNKTENSDVFEKGNDDLKKINEIKDDQQESEVSSPLGNATEETIQDMDKDSSLEEIIEIKETEIDDPQEEGTEFLKSNEIEDDKPNSDAAKFIDDNQVDEESEKEVGEAGMTESAINSQEDFVISSDVEKDGKDEKNITNKTEISDDSKDEQEKIDFIEDDQPKSEADPPQEEGTESLKIK